MLSPPPLSLCTQKCAFVCGMSLRVDRISRITRFFMVGGNWSGFNNRGDPVWETPSWSANPPLLLVAGQTGLEEDEKETRGARHWSGMGGGLPGCPSLRVCGRCVWLLFRFL